MNEPNDRSRRAAMLLQGSAVAAACLLFGATQPTARAADPPAAAAPAGKPAEVRLEKPNGSDIPQIKLTPKAVERLGIQTGQVGEALVVRRQMVSGLVVPVGDKAPVSRPGGGFGGFGGFAAAPTLPGAANLTRVSAPAPGAEPPKSDDRPVLGEVWVLVTLSPGEYERLAKDRPARLLPLATREGARTDLVALPTGTAPQEDLKRSMLSLYYKVPGKDHGLAIHKRMRVELQLDGVEARQKAVPYAAVHYDAKGEAWVYTAPAPLTFERRQVTVERVVGDTALLAQGPDVGTPVVTVGAALLHGTEIFKK